MRQQVEETARDAILVEDAALIRMMGMPVLEALPSRAVPYERLDPFILVHEGRFRLSEMAGKDTKHPHRGFDNLWYVLQGSASTGHTTGPGGSVERARLSEGSLLALRTGRGAWHAEAVGADEVAEGHGDTEFRSVLFWVNLARRDKHVEPSAQVVQQDQIPVRNERDAIVRVLVGEGWLSRAPRDAGAGPRYRVQFSAVAQANGDLSRHLRGEALRQLGVLPDGDRSKQRLHVAPLIRSGRYCSGITPPSSTATASR